MITALIRGLLRWYFYWYGMIGAKLVCGRLFGIDGHHGSIRYAALAGGDVAQYIIIHCYLEAPVNQEKALSIQHKTLSQICTFGRWYIRGTTSNDLA